MTDNDYIFMLYVLYVQWKLNKGGAPVETVIAVVVAIAVTAIVVYFVTSAYHKKVTEAKIGNAEEKAREIIDEAVKTAETKKREGNAWGEGRIHSCEERSG